MPLGILMYFANACAMSPLNITKKVDGHLFNSLGVMLNLYRLETLVVKKDPKTDLKGALTLTATFQLRFLHNRCRQWSLQ